MLNPPLEAADVDDRYADEEMRPSSQDAPMLGPYMLLEEIGRGGQGVVFRAMHRETNEVLAVKTVLPQDAGSSETLMRFQREAAAAQGLDHPHTMPVREVGCSGAGVPFFSMQLALGGTLYQLGAKYRGRWRQVAELLIKISGAVHHAHQHGILHRDLKPGNILFTEDQEPMVTDFGLAKQLTGSNDLTQSCAVLGTPNYVSPEQAAGKTRDLTPASDIYSLGAILFELLTGRPPFVGDNPLDVLRQVASRTPRRPRTFVPSVPKALETICMRCLERQPTDRYHSAQAVADDLKRWLQGRKVTNLPLHNRLWRTIRPQPKARAWCWGGIGLAAVLWVAWTIVGRSPRASSGMTSIAIAVDHLDQNSSLKAIAQQATDELRRGLSNTGLFQIQKGEIDKSESATEVFDSLAYGRAHKAQVVLAGFVRFSGEQVRLITRLMRCDSGEVVWRNVGSVPSDHAASTLPTLVNTVIKDLETRRRANPNAFAGSSNYYPSQEAQMFYARGKELAARTNQRDLQAAVISFRKASDFDPRFVAARATLAFALWVQADTYGELDKLPLATAAAREALAIDPSSAQAHRVIAGCYFKASRNNEALEEFWNALESDPQSAGCCQSLGMCLREMGRPQQAISWLTRAVKLDPAHGALSGSLGESLALCGFDQKAEAALTHAIELDGDRPDFQIAMSALRIWQKQFDEARRLCAQTLHRFPDSRFGLSLAAWIEFCDGNGPQAERYFEKLRAQNSYQLNWEFYGAINPASALAYLAKQSGLTERAHLLMEEACKLDHELLVKYPHNPRILHDLAGTYATAGDTERAIYFSHEAIASGWAEHRSTMVDPRFSTVAKLPRFQEMFASMLPPPP